MVLKHTQRRWLLFLPFLLALATWHVRGQSSSGIVDSLKRQLRQHPQRDTTQAATQILLAYHVHFENPDTAALLAISAAETCRRAGYSKGMGRAYHALSLARRHQANDGLAMDALLKAIPRFERANDKMGLVVCYRDIAILDEKQQYIDRALSFYRKSHGLATQTGNRTEMARLLVHIAIVHNKYRNESDTALALLQQAIDLRQNNLEVNNFILENLGYVFMNRRQYAESVATFERLLATHRQTNNLYGTANLYKALSTVHKRMGNHRRSLRYAESAMEVATAIEEADLRRGAAFLLADNYEQLKDYRNALRYQRMGERIKDSLFTIEKSLVLNDLQTKFELDKQRRAIETQKKELYGQEQELSRKTFQRNAFVVGMVLLATLAFLFYRNTRYQRRNNRLLTEKNAEIQRQKEQLTQLNATKDKLFSIISHDIRSPLNSLEATLQLLQEGLLSPEETQKMVPQLLGKVHQTSALLHNILHWAKSQMGGIVTKRERIDLQAISGYLVDAFRPVAHEKNIVLENRITRPLPAKADKGMTELILRNLLSNAIKFTPTGGKVTVKGQRKNKVVVFSVEDTGTGMSAEQQEKLFDMKTHFSTTGTANEVGTGLGLLLCKEFADKNNGRIWVESRVGGGSIFHVSLPAPPE